MRQRFQRILARLLACALLMGLLTVPAAAGRFTDVPQGHWAEEAIGRSVDLGLFQGETASRFGLGHKMTRAAFATVLCRLFQWELVTPEQGTYDDVQDPSAWYFSAVETAFAHGAVTLQSGDFRPADPITREELAVMLVRALGYGAVAGLAQDLPTPFTDVNANAGYISLAYELGIVSGTSATAFSPDQTATREQAAVMLMRLYDKLHAPAPGRVGIARSPEALGDLTGCAAVAVPAGRLVVTSKALVNETLEPEDAAAIRDAAKGAGAKALLHVAGGVTALQGKAKDTAAVLAEAVADGGYDGLFLDVPKVQDPQRKALTDLVAALDAALGDGLLYVAAEAPAWQGRAYEGYDYAALAALADRLVLRVAPYEKVTEGFSAAPVEPLEEVYYALGQLNGSVPGGKLSLLLTTTGAAWTGGKKSGAVSGEELEKLLKDRGTEDHYSNRYACAYLTYTEKKAQTVVWYLDREAVAARERLAGFFGVDQVCLSSLNGLSETWTVAEG